MPDKPVFVTELLAKHHDRAAFSCGNSPLDDYLKRQAGQDARRNLARLFVHPGEGPNIVAGYYTLGSLSMDAGDLPSEMTRKLRRYPDVPAVLIGRLAVDRRYQGRGMGKVILMDALHRIATLGKELAVHSAVVEPIDDDAVSFYRKYGFLDFASRSDRLFLPVVMARRFFPKAGG
jgi:ribosomal protein S18 acetylase RimI-like enzyme